jgi:hypothetical protein
MTRKALWLLLPALAAACADPASEIQDPYAEDAPPAPPPARPRGAELSFRVPEAWVREEPANRLRRFQFRVPDKQKEHADAEFVVFHFGPSGSRIQENIDRWAAQVRGSEARPQTLEGRLRATWVDLSGTYVGDGRDEPLDEARMLAAVLEHPEGYWYFKLVGPAATVGDWKDEFLALLKEAH